MIKNKNYIFEMCISINGRYMILQDNVFDLQENVSIGNLWESLDVFKTIFNNTDVEDNEYNLIRENLNKKPLLESQKNLYGLRDILLEFNFFQDTWLGREIKDSGEGITDTLTQSWEGLKKFGVSINKNSWGEILNDIGKGVKYVFRRLKNALYSNIGITIDAILVATGVGKTAQWIPWGMVLGLDIWQISNNDWETSMTPTEQWMELIFSSLGLLTAGGVAKILRKTLGPLAKSDPKKLSSTIRNNKTLSNTLLTLKSKLPSLPGFFSRLQSQLKGKFDTGAQFIGQVMKYLSKIIGGLSKFIDTLLGTGRVSKGVKTGALTGGIMYGLDGGQSSLSQVQIQNLNTLKSLESENKDLFDY